MQKTELEGLVKEALGPAWTVVSQEEGVVMVREEARLITLTELRERAARNAQSRDDVRRDVEAETSWLETCRKTGHQPRFV